MSRISKNILAAVTESVIAKKIFIHNASHGILDELANLLDSGQSMLITYDGDNEDRVGYIVEFSHEQLIDKETLINPRWFESIEKIS